MLERIPPAEIALPSAGSSSAVSGGGASGSTRAQPAGQLSAANGNNSAPLIDISGLGLGPAVSPQQPNNNSAARAPAAPAPGSLNDILDIFGPSTAKPAAAAPMADPLGLLMRAGK